jgi:hypothetical protein
MPLVAIHRFVAAHPFDFAQGRSFRSDRPPPGPRWLILLTADRRKASGAPFDFAQGRLLRTIPSIQMIPAGAGRLRLAPPTRFPPFEATGSGWHPRCLGGSPKAKGSTMAYRYDTRKIRFTRR